MKSKKGTQLIIGALVAIVLSLGVLSTTAEAQGRGRHRPRPVVIYRPYYNPFWYRYDPFWDPYWGTTYRTVDPIAYQREQGYNEGRGEGKDDAKKGLPANPTGHKDYLKSNSLAFREAFVKGYNERYREEIAKIQEKARDKHGD